MAAISRYTNIVENACKTANGAHNVNYAFLSREKLLNSRAEHKETIDRECKTQSRITLHDYIPVVPELSRYII